MTRTPKLRKINFGNILTVVVGILIILTGLAFVLFSVAFFGSDLMRDVQGLLGATIISVALMVLAITLFITGVGIALKKNWARLLSIPALIATVLFFARIVSSATYDYLQGALEPEHGLEFYVDYWLIYGAMLLLAILCLVYLLLPKTKQLFLTKKQKNSSL